MTSFIPFAQKCCDFLTGSPDPFFAVQNSVEKLEAAGFVRLSKRDPFFGQIHPNGKYFYTINHSALVAFAVGGQYKAGNGFKVIGGHTDSPNLKVKPHSKRGVGPGDAIQLSVECYGGGLWHTWFDRDLSISGRVLVRDVQSTTGEEKIVQKLVNIQKPVARVSSLCIHLQTADERDAFRVNKEDHLVPIIGIADAVKGQLVGGMDFGDDPWKKDQEPLLIQLIADNIGVAAKDIADFELNLYDSQPATIGGCNSEFLYSARLDNLATCFVAVETLVDYTNSESFQNDVDISMICLFDHEEVGSESAVGAGAPIMSQAIERISAALSGGSAMTSPDIVASVTRKSFILSVDMAHAIHPNYSAKHDKNHAPKMNAGIAVKINNNQRYSTNGVTGFILREIARMAKLPPLQDFIVRNDCPCGTTIGPILSSATGIRTADAGMPQLSMHSCREVMGVADLTHGYNFFLGFFNYFREIDDKLEG